MENSLIAPELYPPDSFITIWRISFDTDAPLMRRYYPRIPKSTMFGEDEKTPRICFCRRIEDCFTACPKNNSFDIGAEFVAFPLRISVYDPYFIPTERISEKVPDAEFTGECWYTDAILLHGIPMRIDDFSGAVYFLATEQDREPVYSVLRDKFDFSKEELSALDGTSVYDLVNFILNGEPRYWAIDACLGDTVADICKIPNNMRFECVKVSQISERSPSFHEQAAYERT